MCSPIPLSFLLSSLFDEVCNKGNGMNNRNGLFFVIGALLVVVIGMGIYIFREESKPSGVDISIGEKGISVEEK